MPSKWTGVVKWYNKHCSQDLAPFCIELLLFEVAQFLNKWLSHCCWDPCWKGTWMSPSELYPLCGDMVL